MAYVGLLSGASQKWYTIIQCSGRFSVVKEEDTIMFEKKKKFAYEQLRQELGEEYEIVYTC